MGLLDALFQDSNYGGQGGGLLDFLRSTQAQDQQYQPSAGFPAPPTQTQARQFDPAMFDPNTYAPNQAQPIGVGGYQMPRVGSADLYNPQQVNTPANAQPAQGQLPPTDVSAQSHAPQPQQQTLPTFLSNQGGLGAGLRGFANNLHTGPVGALVGGIGSAMGMQNPAQQDRAAQYQALVPILGPQKAMLAVLNPEAGKTLLSEALTNKEKYQVISEDPLAGKKYGFVNDRDQTINGQPIGQGANTSPAGGMEAIQQAQQAGVKGDALYQYLPPGMQNTVKAMIEGRQPLPSTAAMRNPATLALIDAAHAIDPQFDATVWKARNDAGPDWTKGKSSEMVRAANQTLTHVGSLMNAMDALKNTPVPPVNAVGNFVDENLIGGGKPGAFRTNAHAVAEEMSKVFKGANLSDSEIKHWEQNLSENMSPEQQRAQISKLSELLHGSLQALEEKRLTAMGPAMAEKQGPLIKAEGQKVLDRIDQWVKGNGGTSSGNVTSTGVKWSVVP